MTRAFLLGAGATRADYNDAPLSKDFFTKLFLSEQELYSAINKELTNKFSVDKNNPSNELAKYDIEDLLIKAQEEYSRSLNSFLLRSVFKAIYLLIGKTTDSLENLMVNHETQKKISIDKKLKTLINDPSFTDSDFFLTLNYDLHLERELFDLNNRVDYGFEKDQFDYHPLPQINWKIDNAQQNTIFHLHGSLNWVKLGEDKLSIHTKAIEPELKGNEANLILVPPGQKDINGILEYVWTKAQLRLDSADELIIIGSRLNPKDTKLTGMISEFAQKNGSDKVKVLYYTKEPEENDKELENYKEILGDKIKTYSKGLDHDESIEFIYS